MPAIERPPSAPARLAARGATSLPELHAKQAAVKYAFEKRGTSKFVRKLVRTADLSDALAVSAELNALSDAELRDESMRLRNDGGLSLLHKSFSEATQRLQLAVHFELAIATRTGTNFSLASAATAANGGISGIGASTIGASTLRLPQRRPVGGARARRRATAAPRTRARRSGCTTLGGRRGCRRRRQRRRCWRRRRRRRGAGGVRSVACWTGQAETLHLDDTHSLTLFIEHCTAKRGAEKGALVHLRGSSAKYVDRKDELVEAFRAKYDEVRNSAQFGAIRRDSAQLDAAFSHHSQAERSLTVAVNSTPTPAVLCAPFDRLTLIPHDGSSGRPRLGSFEVGYELVVDGGDGRRVLGGARLYTKIRSGRFPSVASPCGGSLGVCRTICGGRKTTPNRRLHESQFSS